MRLLQNLKKEIVKLKEPKRAKASLWYFKTKKGEYGYGDKFLGLTMGQQRILAKKYIEIDFVDIQILVQSKYHEERMIALLILVYKYNKSDEKQKKIIFNFYIKNTKFINNWDLVDVTTPNIVGSYLKNKDKKLLYKFAKSNNLWKKRISILATFTFIKEGQFEDSLKIAKILINDKHDLIHKALGWMLREIGKRNIEVEKMFLNEYYKSIPRTTLRYAIEKFKKSERQMYLKGTV